MSTLWPTVLIALDARAEGRHADAFAMFADEACIDVAYVRGGPKKQAARPVFDPVEDYGDDLYSEVFVRPMTADECADERRRCRCSNEATQWLDWVEVPHWAMTGRPDLALVGMEPFVSLVQQETSAVLAQLQNDLMRESFMHKTPPASLLRTSNDSIEMRLRSYANMITHWPRTLIPDID